MKRLMILAAIVLCALGSFAQENYVDLLQRINETDYIFEGRVLKTKPYQTADQKMIYTSNVVQITKVFKGANFIDCGTIELITDGGQLPGIGLEGSHSLELKEGDQGIFLTSATNKELPGSYFPFTIPTKVEAKFDWQSFIKYLYEYNDFKAYDLWDVYDSLSNLYDLTELATQVSYVDCDQSKLVIPTTNQPVVYPYSPQPLPHYDRATAMQTKSRITHNKATHSRPKVSRSTETLKYTLSNMIITGTSPKYLEYDINVADASPNHYFATGYARIVYNTVAFGSHIVTNNHISVTNGALATSSCYFNASPIDDNPNTFEISIGWRDDVPVCKGELFAFPQQMVHVKMEIQNCGVTSKIAIRDTSSFFSPSLMSVSSSYSQSSNDSMATEYDAVATDSVSVPGCDAHITGFSPLVVRAGVGDILNIEGFQFGSTRGNGQIYFYSADNPNTGMSQALNDSDFISWSDTLITVKVPSVQDTANGPQIGSGTFRIVTNTSDKDTSASPLTIYYALQNDWRAGSKLRMHLYNRSGNGGYKFYVDTAISHNPAVYGCVVKAMHDWVCATGVYFEIVGDTFGLPHSFANDGINFITFGPRPVNIGASCFSLTNYCPSTNLITKEEMDIIIANIPMSAFFIDTTGTLTAPQGTLDLYHILLHEIGHGVGHNHVIDSTRVMYYTLRTIPFGGLSPADRVVNLRVDAAAVDGGTAEVADAMTITQGQLGCGSTPMLQVTVHCIHYLGMDDVVDKSTLVIYPNPFGSHITVRSDYPMTSVTLTAMDGRQISTADISNSTQTTISLDPGLADGVYLISITDTHNGTTVAKLIHTQD